MVINNILFVIVEQIQYSLGRNLFGLYLLDENKKIISRLVNFPSNTQMLSTIYFYKFIYFLFPDITIAAPNKQRTEAIASPKSFHKTGMLFLHHFITY